MALLGDGLGVAHERLNNGHMLKLNEPILTSILARTIILPHMKKVVCILAVTLGCLISSEVRSAPKPITLAWEQTTTLHVGELPVLHIPSDRRYLHSPNGACRDALALVKQPRRDVTFRGTPRKGRNYYQPRCARRGMHQLYNGPLLRQGCSAGILKRPRS